VSMKLGCVRSAIAGTLCTVSRNPIVANAHELVCATPLPRTPMACPPSSLLHSHAPVPRDLLEDASGELATIDDDVPCPEPILLSEEDFASSIWEVQVGSFVNYVSR
jgi:hypothetical protein